MICTSSAEEVCLLLIWIQEISLFFFFIPALHTRRTKQPNLSKGAASVPVGSLTFRTRSRRIVRTPYNQKPALVAVQGPGGDGPAAAVSRTLPPHPCREAVWECPVPMGPMPMFLAVGILLEQFWTVQHHMTCHIHTSSSVSGGGLP